MDPLVSDKLASAIQIPRILSHEIQLESSFPMGRAMAYHNQQISHYLDLDGTSIYYIR